MIRQLQVHVLEIVGLVLLVEFFTQSDEQVVVLDRVCDGGELFRDLALVKEVRHLRPVVLMLRAERVGKATWVVLELTC